MSRLFGTDGVRGEANLELTPELAYRMGRAATLYFGEDDSDEAASYIDEERVLDVDRLIFNEILVNWPAKVLCKSDCKGICPKCGTNLNLATCDCEQGELDPRMAQFQDVFNKFKEV